ncbi:SDR family oxidoreductase [Paenibacillus xerothermodurans]|uniref:SDR family NAD(P)-dependent oxidoreductase n=1 Tax=Paenibacillus xerothermodurans TaxID=1977292 RepID=A0A2W1NAC5_PAEXE|nr:SDR family NAD(P)-dependent oxidoreductase [Paenibacillus xerothermodurans]PZE21609.1 SDR family NAD(P)-dependent oxidoreductase [Paenibacillus xerothermodurans]
MKRDGNTVLITGGASGIGLALAERFLKTGNTVIVCGRRHEKLQEAATTFPGLHIKVCDVSDTSQRQELLEWATREFPQLNVLINNAGIQQRVDLLDAKDEWEYYQKEIQSNFDAPVHLTMLFVPHLRKQQHAAIINVSSGLAITPGAWVPIYSATKAALHSFTVSLRIQLADTGVEVLEVLPPAVNTDLGGVGLHTFGAPLDDFADSVFSELFTGKQKIGYGGTEERLLVSAREAEELSAKMYEGFMQR